MLSLFSRKTRILMVCKANICRSPMAEGILKQQLRQRNLLRRYAVDSAGTQVQVRGQKPDARAQRVVAAEGIDISRVRSRPLNAYNYSKYGYILAMDDRVFDDIWAEIPSDLRYRLHRVMDFAGEGSAKEVPDPYFGNEEGFREVFTLLQRAIGGFVDACCD